MSTIQIIISRFSIYFSIELCNPCHCLHKYGNCIWYFVPGYRYNLYRTSYIDRQQNPPFCIFKVDPVFNMPFSFRHSNVNLLHVCRINNLLLLANSTKASFMSKGTTLIANFFWICPCKPIFFTPSNTCVVVQRA